MALFDLIFSEGEGKRIQGVVFGDKSQVIIPQTEQILDLNSILRRSNLFARPSK